MKIRPKGIPKFEGGNKTPYWWMSIPQVEENSYNRVWDVQRGIINPYDFGQAWSSKTLGYNQGRYAPLNFTKEQIEAIERQPYYQRFQRAKYDESGKFSQLGETFTRANDVNYNPKNRYYDSNGNLIPQHNALGRNTLNVGPRGVESPYQRDKAASYDHLAGQNHNIYGELQEGYYINTPTGKYWVSEEEAKSGKYDIYQTPDRMLENGLLTRRDYELVLKNNDPQQKPEVQQETPETPETPEEEKDPNEQEVRPYIKNKIDWTKLGQGLKSIAPGILGAGRLALTLWNNNRIYNEALAGVRPDLKQTYYTHRQVVGDEATKQAYYRRAAEGQTKAARPFTSDADKQMAYQFEAKRVGDELRAQGDLADNQEIRRTSDESNQHQWANIQRATEVANANTASINAANALRHNLIAQKYAANGTSVDNYLKELETKWNKNLAERRAIDNQVWSLQMQDKISNDKFLLEYQKEWDDAYKAGDSAKQMEAAKKIKARQNQIYISLLQQRRQTLFGEKGIKLTYKYKDDLLYKSTRDAVEHFRKMSKMSSDAQNRRKPKIERLAPHPKGHTRRYQQGGLAPFMVYTPATMGGETSMSSSIEGATTSSSGSSKSSDKGKETLDLIKSLFSAISEKGLPSDVNLLYQSLNGVMERAKAFGQDMSTEDLAGLYLQQMNNLSKIQYFKKEYDQAKTLVQNNKGLNEVAITPNGQYVVQDPETGKIAYTSNPDFNKQKVIPVTNGQLLQLRALANPLAFDTNYIQIASNGVGIEKISEYLKGIIPALKQNVVKQDSYVSKQIAKGLEALENAPEGDYKRTITDKNSLIQVQQALKFVYSSLPENMKAAIRLHAKETGSDVEDYISSLIGAQISYQYIDQYSSANGGSGSGSGAGGLNTDMTPEIAFALGMGDRQDFVMADKTMDGMRIKTNSMPITDENHHNLPNATLENVSRGSYGGQYDQENITMGGVKISTTGMNDVLITGGRIYSAELPIDLQAQRDGIIRPDLRFLSKIEAAEEDVRKAGITKRDNLTNQQAQIINKIYSNHQLPIVYDQTAGGPRLNSRYQRFAIMHGQATASAFQGDMTFNNSVEKISNKNERDQFETTMKIARGDDKYSISDGHGIGSWRWGEDDIYRGTIFIPMNSNILSALAGTGYKANPSEYMTIDALQQQRDEALRLNYRSAGNASRLN